MADQVITKEAILETAEQVLRRFGPDKTSVVDVARSLNVSHGLIYRHFPSKASLQEAVTERWLNSISEPLSLVFERDCSATQRLRLWLDTLISIKHNKAHQDPELFAMYAILAEESVEAVNRHIANLIGQIASIVEEGMATQEFKTVDVKDVAKGIFMATVRFHHPAHAKEWSSVTIVKDFQVVWHLLLSGIVQ
jgi:AcrR family transcriptional regulator